MTQPDDRNSIPWREWSEDAFDAARAQGKPVLLTLGATWCHWCHVMDETAYADDRVIRLVNSGFIPVRVDVDQRPDISLRYNQGTYPSVAFLTGDGEFLAGRPLHACGRDGRPTGANFQRRIRARNSLGSANRSAISERWRHFLI